MVDLHQALEPTGSTPPPPVGEIAARAKRRQRRRIVATGGAASVLVVVAAITIVSLLDRTTGSPTVADRPTEDPDRSTGAASSTTVEPTATTPTPSSTPSTTVASTSAPTDGSAVAEESAAGGAPATTVPASTSGLRTSTTRTSEWDDGYCFQMEVINQAGDGQGWRIVLDLNGSIDTVWNATATADGDRTIFAGQAGYNTDLAPGASTSFGACVRTNP